MNDFLDYLCMLYTNSLKLDENGNEIPIQEEQKEIEEKGKTLELKKKDNKNE